MEREGRLVGARGGELEGKTGPEGLELGLAVDGVGALVEGRFGKDDGLGVGAGDFGEEAGGGAGGETVEEERGGGGGGAGGGKMEGGCGTKAGEEEERHYEERREGACEHVKLDSKEEGRRGKL